MLGRILMGCVLMGVAGLGAQPAAGAGIEFFHGSLDEAVAAAKKQKKLVFVDVYTDWCAPCKKMAKTVFVLEDVGKVFNKHFISYKLNAEDAAQQGPEFARRFEVTSYPTYVFLDGAGKVVAKQMGTMNAEAFKLAALEATGLGSKASPCADYEGGDRSIDAFVRCIGQKTLINTQAAVAAMTARPGQKLDAAVSAALMEKHNALMAEYNAYFRAVPEKQLLTAQGFKLITHSPFSQRGEVAVEFLVSHYPDYARVVDKELLARTVVEANSMSILTGSLQNKPELVGWIEDIRGPLADAYALVGIESGADPYEWEKASSASYVAVGQKNWWGALAAEQRLVAVLPEKSDRIDAFAMIGPKLMALGCDDLEVLRAGAGHLAVAFDREKKFDQALMYAQVLGRVGEKAIAAKILDEAQALVTAEADEKKKTVMTEKLAQTRALLPS